MNGQTEHRDDEIREDENDVTAAAAGQEDAGENQADGTGEVDSVAELQAQVEENWNKFVRATAELENVRKRAARDVDNARKFAIERFGADLLDVRDSLEMGLSTVETADAEQLRIGSEATLKLLATTMERFGIQELDPQGEPFDPQFHEAMTMQPSADVEAGSVLTVFQKGYTLNGRLLRPARVVVAAEMAETDEN